jgi:DNA topoisomerase-3
VTTSGPPALDALLSTRFGHPRFRPYQREVCEAAAAGADVLLVMPTGAGKSLCYQLPGVARGGVTLVISPLIALMEDQATKLQASGFRAERIHSGIPRERARAACRLYLDGNLDFLFIAPERMRVPGFPEMLGRRPPSLIAIDEAHCISAWGHDFRPDYRMLKHHLPLLGGSPIMALTATATPEVQDDIVRELGMRAERRFIHGFRRDNIAVEVCERPPKERHAAVVELLSDASRRPAIVYAQARKTAEEVARAFPASCKAEAYHAGMLSSERERVQRAFLSGECDVVVATIAFGMGVDKPNVRSVVHLALPGSVEGYYQEIGRAGRDGLPSRAVLMHSFADVKTHQFFFERDYPEVTHLVSVMAILGARRETRDTLLDKVSVDGDVLDKILEKLWMFGAVTEDEDGVLVAHSADFERAYSDQRAHRWQQTESMQRLAETAHCRMAALVMHFGDVDDARTRCGMCDVCAPEKCVMQSFRSASQNEERVAAAIRAQLRIQEGMSAGQMQRALHEKQPTDRRLFDVVLRALVSRGEVRLVSDSFVKDGRNLVFHRIFVGPEADAEHGALSITETKGGGKDKARAPRVRSAEKASSSGAGAGAQSGKEAFEAAQNAPLIVALREFRRAEALRAKIPAFRVLTDRVLFGIVERSPRSIEELCTVSGVGPSLANKYGKRLLELIAAFPSR